MKTELKNVLTVTLTEAKKTVKTMSDKQIANMVEKLNKLLAIVIAESNKRFEAKLEEEADAEIENAEDPVEEIEESESDEV